EVAGQKLTVVQVVNGTKVKNTLNGMSSALGAAEKTELAQAAAMQEISQLTPLLGTKYTIKAEKVEDVNGAPTGVVPGTGKAFKATKLFCEKKLGLLVKISRKCRAPGVGDPQEVVEETILSDYKLVDGVMTPMKMTVTHDGKKFMNMTVVESKLMEKADPK